MLAPFVLGLLLGAVLGSVGLAYAILRAITHKAEKTKALQQTEREKSSAFLREQDIVDKLVVGTTKLTLQVLYFPWVVAALPAPFAGWRKG